jgi:hypothetical protein
MTGFIRGIFGSKKKSDAQPVERPQKDEKAFFLDPDEAKTFGNIDYMRTAKSVKKTFPKGKVSGEYTKAVSATETMDFSQPSTPQPVKREEPSAPSTPAPSFSSEPAPRRQPDTSMDLFRNMAKDIKKR